MWSLYLLPGRAITRFLFLFPGHSSGSVTATRRRDESGCAHFLFATLFWIPAGLIGSFWVQNYFFGPPSVARGPSVTERSAGDSLRIATNQALQLIGAEQATDAPANEVQHTADTADASVTAPDRDDQAAGIAADPAAFPKVARAMRKAAKKGKATRWKQGRLHGYAVPSDGAVDGCRMVQVSVDHRADLASTPIKLCTDDQ